MKNKEIEQAIPEIIEIQTWNGKTCPHEATVDSQTYHKGASSIELLKKDFLVYLKQKVKKNYPYYIEWRIAPEISKNGKYYYFYARFFIEEYDDFTDELRHNLIKTKDITQAINNTLSNKIRALN